MNERANLRIKLISFAERYIRRVIGRNAALQFRFFLQNSDKRHFRKKMEQVYAMFLLKGDLYFDIGSNYGQKIEPIVGKGYQIIAVEPQVECCRYLENIYGHETIVLECGVGENEEDRGFYKSSAHPLASFSVPWMEAVKKSDRFNGQTWEWAGTKKMITLNQMIDKFGLPALIKIDVEGYEAQVLHGLSVPVNALIFEYTVPEKMDALMDCLRLIQEIYEGEDITFNYMSGDDIQWVSARWLGFDEMVEEINTSRFIQSSAGDIYLRKSRLL